MSIEMNFGWLNDFTGSRFAPITLANLVLLDTSKGTTETLLDYVVNANENIQKDIKKQKQDILGNKNDIKRIVEQTPQIEDENGNVLQPYAAQRAVRLVQANSSGEVNSSDMAGINTGSKRLPVYFTEGMPEVCNTRDYTDEDAYETVEYEIITDKDGIVGVTTVNSQPIGRLLTDQYLEVDIKGVAEHATTAKESIKSKQAALSDVAKKSLTLNDNLYIGGKLEYVESLGTSVYKNYYIDPDTKVIKNKEGIIGDIVGTIETKNTQITSSLELKEIWDEDEGALGFGNAYMGGNEISEGTYYIPSFQLDKKGRVIGATAQECKIMANLNLNEMGTVPANNKIIYLMGVQLNALTTDDGKPKDKYYHSYNEDISKSIYIDANENEPVLMGAAWNDYAEFRRQKEIVEPGYCVKSNDDGRVEKTSERLSICDGIVSDTFGFSIGKHADYETPLAVSGRVLAYYEGNKADYHAGDVVCASENGKICKMTREEIKEYPDRIVGIISEIPSYDEWNGNKINNRIWVKVK